MTRTNKEKAEDAIYEALVELEKFKIDEEFKLMYSEMPSNDLQFVFTILHSQFVRLFRDMNMRLPTKTHTAHYWAEQSRDLILCIDVCLNIYYAVKETEYEFNIPDYYMNLFDECRQFLSHSGGSELPTNMDKIKIYYKTPIFNISKQVTIKTNNNKTYATLSMLGQGSYAHVYKYRDSNYNKNIVIKRAKNDLNEKELERFEKEFKTLNELSSPYIIEVYKYDSSIPEYSMEYMDINLEKYIAINNTKLNKRQRKGIVYQILRGFEYLNNKKLLHRDINPNNILIKLYDDVPVVKISDFGLVKEPNSKLTSVNTELKGYYNDPILKTIGFQNYSIEHEIYALCFVIYYVMTGRVHYRETGSQALDYLIKKGIQTDTKNRPANIREVRNLFKNV